MKGNVLSFDALTNRGKISGFDGRRYQFVLQDWECRSPRPQVGVEVDFEIDHNSDSDQVSARAIFPLALPRPITSRTAYILLVAFLGIFGIHNFVAGYNGRGLAQLLLTVLSLCVFSLFVWIWAIVEAVTVTEDVEGKKMI